MLPSIDRCSMCNKSGYKPIFHCLCIMGHTTRSQEYQIAYCILMFELTAFSLLHVIFKQPATPADHLRLTETFPNFLPRSSKDTTGLTTPISHMVNSHLLPWLQGSTPNSWAHLVSQTPDAYTLFSIIQFFFAG